MSRKISRRKHQSVNGYIRYVVEEAKTLATDPYFDPTTIEVIPRAESRRRWYNLNKGIQLPIRIKTRNGRMKLYRGGKYVWVDIWANAFAAISSHDDSFGETIFPTIQLKEETQVKDTSEYDPNPTIKIPRGINKTINNQDEFGNLI